MNKKNIKKIAGVTTTALMAAFCVTSSVSACPVDITHMEPTEIYIETMPPYKIGKDIETYIKPLSQYQIDKSISITLTRPKGYTDILTKILNSQEDKKVYEEPNSESEFVLKVIALTNAERQKNGLNALKINHDLCKAAQKHAEDMSNNNYFSHESKDGRTMSDRINEYAQSYSCAGENIASGQRSPEDVVKSWMNSSGHKANILNAKYKEIGVGFSNNYWVQDFIG